MLVSQVTKSVIVHCVVLNTALLPSWRTMLEAIPIGCGLKGGIARKILKILSGLKRNRPDLQNELNGEGDIDILVAVEKTNPQKRKNLRQQFTGKKFGDMTVEAKDIEIQDNLKHYFLSRDITMNEALAFRVSKDAILLFYTEEAETDSINGVIRPAIHCLNTPFMQVWQYDENRNAIPTPKSLARCIIRWLKGHGLQYGIDEETWAYYKVNSLNYSDLFRIIRHFADDDAKFERCIYHLQALELLSSNINPNMLWGEILFEVNRKLAHYGKRLTFSDPTVEAIEDWIAQKEQQSKKWEMIRETQQALGIDIEPNDKALVSLPYNLDNFPCFFME